MLIWIIQAVAAALLGLFAIFPAVGPYNYGAIGLVVGLLAACIIFFELEGELEDERTGAKPPSRGATFLLGLLGGAAAGCIWPAAITTGLLWVWLSGGEDDDEPPAIA